MTHQREYTHLFTWRMTLLLGMAFVLSACAFMLFAHKAQAGEQTTYINGVAVKYEVDVNTDEVTIKSWSQNAKGTIAVPSTIEDKTVTALGSSVFSGCAEVTSITLRNTIKSIGDGAFAGCSSLKSITMPASVKSVGKWMFSNCTGLESITLPSQLADIGKGTFHNCAGLKAITIPETVTSIEDEAFWGCESLESLKIPASVEELGDRIVAGCTNLKNLEVAPGNPNFCTVDGVLFNAGKTELIYYPNYATRTSYEIPRGVETIKNNAFAKCEALTRVTFASPSSVKTIEAGAFGECTGLTRIEIPSSVTRIGVSAFGRCSRLTAVLITPNLINIGDDAFGDAIDDIYFTGSEFQWERILMYSTSFSTAGIDVHFNMSRIPDASFVKGKDPTCTEWGSRSYYTRSGKYYEDADCGKRIKDLTKWRTDPPKGHKHATTFTRASLTADGKKTDTCTVCGEVFEDKIIPRIVGAELSPAAFTYNGKVRTPGITVKDAAGKVIDSANYTVSYASGRKNVGTYKIEISFKGDYEGTLPLDFKINPKNTKIKKLVKAKKAFTVKWKKLSTKMSKTRIKGYQVRYSTKASMKSAKTKTIKGYKKTSVKIKKLKAKKKYYVQIRTYMKVGGKTYYSAWSAKKKVKTK